MRRLRKCPFCGSGRDWLRLCCEKGFPADDYFVLCGWCEARGPVSCQKNAKDYAVREWNRRSAVVVRNRKDAKHVT